ncbi:MAG: 50S ribosomal protein L3 N(5)-glutamine methyltransferase [Gammaproteobacteria bacterium]
MEPIEPVANRLRTIRDLVRFGASAFNEAGLVFGHGTDNALDEALALVLHSLHLDHGLAPEYLAARLTEAEIARTHALFVRRIEGRLPAAYLTREAWFAGLPFYVDERVVIPRSPIAELIEKRFEPWYASESAGWILDLCCGSGCIGIACACAFPQVRVTLADGDSAALEVARCNVADYGLEARVEVIESDLYAALAGKQYDLVVCNPPYVDAATYAVLPPEYLSEPRVGLESGEEGLDHPLAVLRDAAEHLTPSGVLVLEVGAARSALERTMPNLDAVWVEFARGGEGVAIITRAALSAPNALERAA